MTQEDEIRELQKELQQNPKSVQFARLAEMYLSRDMTDEAESLVRQGLKFHPRSTSGLILLGRLLKLKKQTENAIAPLTEATHLAPDNWRAWLELAEAQLELKNGKQALTAFKKVLFFNPTQPLARRAVAKLELLTADEYEEDLFQMQKLPENGLSTEPQIQSKKWGKPDSNLIRALSFIDALIVRQENQKALKLLNQHSESYGAHPEIEARRLKLSVFEKPDYIEPKSAAPVSESRLQIIRTKKLAALEMLLRRIESNKSELL